MKNLLDNNDPFDIAGDERLDLEEFDLDGEDGLLSKEDTDLLALSA